MKMIFKSDGGGSFEDLKPGTYAATPVASITMGTQKESPFPDSTPKPQLLLTWEVDERRQDGKRFTADQWVTASLHPKAKLTQMLESWRGKPLTDGEEFSTQQILGKTALVTIVLNQKGYPKVDGVTGLPRGMEPINAEAALVYFDLYDPDWDAFNGLRDGLQNRIQDSVEWAQLYADKKPAAFPEAADHKAARGALLAKTASTADFNDDLPF